MIELERGGWSWRCCGLADVKAEVKAELVGLSLGGWRPSEAIQSHHGPALCDQCSVEGTNWCLCEN